MKFGIKTLFSEIIEFLPENANKKLEVFAGIWHKFQKSMAIWVKKKFTHQKICFFTKMTTDFEFCAKY